MSLQTIATALAEAERTGRPIAPISVSHPEVTVADAYAIQSLNVAARGVEVVGYKVGLTSAPMQELLGVDEPDYGVLYDDRVHLTGAHITLDGLIAPMIEPEVAFLLKADLRGPGLTASDVLAATEYVIPALEVVDSRIRDWKIGLIDTIADNASCHCAIVGSERHAPDQVDLRSTAVELANNDTVLKAGVGSAVLGDPALAVAWLANALADHGVGMRAGQIALSGSITAAIPVVADDHVVADFGAFGRVEAWL